MSLRGSATLFLAVSLSAVSSRARGDDTATRRVPVVEPGKPMRFELVKPPQPATPTITAPSAAACALEKPLDRRRTPSSACLECHDGSKALQARTGHKYDVEYARPASDLRVDPEKFNANVVLADGKVTCLTCHDPASTLPGHLAGPTSGDVDKRLCVACHIH